MADTLNVYEFFLRNRLIYDKSQRKIQIRERDQKEQGFGTVYTPIEIVSTIVHYLHTKIPHHSTQNKLKIADLACGTGRFLIEWHNQEGESNNCAYFGYDVDQTALAIAQDSPLPCSNTSWVHQDVLLNDEIESKKKFDVILGNPPYIESRAIPDDYWNQIKKNITLPSKSLIFR